MAAMMASTFALSRPSEKLGTHSTSVDMGARISYQLASGAKPRTARGSMTARESRSLVARLLGMTAASSDAAKRGHLNLLYHMPPWMVLMQGVGLAQPAFDM